jgi:alpha-beta hydrolase superfamily lysophospholipase
MRFWKKLSAKGYHVIGYDMTGHGRSAIPEQPLTFVKEHKNLIDDGLEFVHALYSGTSKVSFGPKNAALPFVLAGISIGGTVVLNIARELWERKVRASMLPVHTNLRGVLLICPVIEQTVEPNWFETTALKTLKSIGFGKSSLGPKVVNSKYFPSPESYKTFTNDPYCYDGGMILQTGTSMLALIQVTKELIPRIAFPFVVFHAEDDPLIPLQGSKDVIKQAKTAQDDKKLFTYLNASHYLLLDETVIDVVVDDATRWIYDRVAKFGKESRDARNSRKTLDQKKSLEELLYTDESVDSSLVLPSDIGAIDDS